MLSRIKVFSILENTVHQCINRSANQQVDMGVVFGLVPNVLYLAEYGWVDIVKLLKLIEYQIERHAFSVFHAKSEQIPK